MPRPVQQTSSARAENKLGLKAFEDGNIIKAVQHFTTAITMDSMFVPAFVNRGNVYKTQGRQGYEKAVADFSSVIDFDSNTAVAYYSRGGAYLALGNTQKASEDCKACMSLDPEFIEARCLQAEIETALGNFEIARDMYGAILEKYPALEEMARDGMARATARLEEKRKKKDDQGDEEIIDGTLPLLHFVGTYTLSTMERGHTKVSFQYNPSTNSIFKVMIGLPPEPSLYSALKDDFLRITDKDGYVYAGTWRYDTWQGEVLGWGGKGTFKMTVKGGGLSQSMRLLSLGNLGESIEKGRDGVSTPKRHGALSPSFGPLTPGRKQSSERSPRRKMGSLSPVLSLSPGRQGGPTGGEFNLRDPMSYAATKRLDRITSGEPAGMHD